MGKSTVKKEAIFNDLLKKSSTQKFHVKDIVFAKTSTHPPWPARIRKRETDYIYKVDFFGVNYWADIQESDLQIFNQMTANNYLKLHSKNGKLIKSIEIALKKYDAAKKGQSEQNSSSNNQRSRSLKSQKKTKKIAKNNKVTRKSQKHQSQDIDDESQHISEIQEEQSSNNDLDGERESKSYSHPPSFEKNKKSASKSHKNHKNRLSVIVEKKQKEKESSSEEQSHKPSGKKKEQNYEEDSDPPESKKMKIQSVKQTQNFKKKMNLDLPSNQDESKSKVPVQFKTNQKNVNQTLKGSISKKQLTEKVASISENRIIVEQEQSKISNEPQTKYHGEKDEEDKDNPKLKTVVGQRKKSVIVSPKRKAVDDFSENSFNKKTSSNVQRERRKRNLKMAHQIQLLKTPLKYVDSPKSQPNVSQSSIYSESSDVAESSPKNSSTFIARNSILNDQDSHESYSQSSNDEHKDFQLSDQCLSIVNMQLAKQKSKKLIHQIMIENYRKAKKKSSRLQLYQNQIRVGIQFRPFDECHYLEEIQVDKCYERKLINRTVAENNIRLNKTNKSRKSSNGQSSPQISSNNHQTPSKNQNSGQQGNKFSKNNDISDFNSPEEGQIF